MSDTSILPTITPPHNEEAEQVLLGTLLMSNRAFEKVGEFVRAEYFYDPLHQRIFAVIAAAIEKGERADAVTLRRYFENDPDAGNCGSYLAELAAGFTNVINVTDYGRLIHDLFMRRQLMEIAYDILAGATSAALDDSAERQIEAAETALFEIGERRERNALIPANVAVCDTLARIEMTWKSGSAITGVTTGLIDLDRMTGGMKPGQVWILAARPAMGKSALAITTTARRAAMSGVPVGVFSVEMTRDELVGRWLAAETGISTQDQDRGEFDACGWDALYGAACSLSSLPVVIDDSDSLTPSGLRQRIRRMKRKHKVGLIIVDHLQRMSGDRQHRSDYEERSAVVKAVKSAAKSAEVPILLLCQLSRAVEQREDKRPQMSDLRESGRIEEEADVVIGIYRDEYYASKEEPIQRDDSDDKFNDRVRRWETRMAYAANKAEIIILKHRGGRTGIVNAHFNGARTLFSDLAKE